MIVEIAALLVATAFAVLVGYLVPMLIQLRKTIAESEQLLEKMSGELPSLVREMRAMTENVNTLVDQTRDGVDHAAVFLHAVGEIGDTVQHVHETVRGKSGSLLVNVASMVAGFRAASAVVKGRMSKEGGNSNGR
ncbi:MAG: DUF948 domain-containing protein [Nitrospiraceae bacterium]